MIRVRDSLACNGRLIPDCHLQGIGDQLGVHIPGDCVTDDLLVRVADLWRLLDMRILPWWGCRWYRPPMSALVHRR